MKEDSKIYVAGHRGMVGASVVRRLRKGGYDNLITVTSLKLNLKRQAEVEEFFAKHKPEYVFVCSARVGGIQANNNYPANFIYDNLMIQSNIIHSAYLNKVKKLLFLGSSCVYPKFSKIPIKEDYLLTGALEPSNEAYAIAKIAGLKMCEYYHNQYGCNFISAMPTNLYGPRDRYDLNSSHVLPALLKKAHLAKKNKTDKFIVWGSGTPKREILHTDDLADATLFLMQNYNSSKLINVGSGEELTIKELANLVKEVVGFKGKIEFDTSKPDGTMRKLVDISKITDMGWKPKILLKEGLQRIYLEKQKDWER